MIAGYAYSRQHNTCFKLVPEVANYSSAESHCSQDNAHLITIDNDRKNDFISHSVNTTNGNNFSLLSPIYVFLFRLLKNIQSNNFYIQVFLFNCSSKKFEYDCRCGVNKTTNYIRTCWVLHVHSFNRCCTCARRSSGYKQYHSATLSELYQSGVSNCLCCGMLSKRYFMSCISVFPRNMSIMG